MPEIIGVIPARYASTRFPGKPLALINGKSLVQRTYENAQRCKALEHIIVATDDERIFEHVKGFGGHVTMTSVDCPTGTDRLAEVIRNEHSLKDVQIAINIQGDEPCLDPSVIQGVVEALKTNPKADVSTAVIRIKSEEEALNPSVTKCVIDCHGYALYFSRTLIPAGKSLRYHPDIVYYKHLGIYGFRRQFLLHYAELSPTPLQMVEDLEQLKVLEHGYKIAAAVVNSESMDVNTPEDIKKVEQLLCKQNSSSSPAGSAPR